jgi:hypothetical protein
MNFFWNYLCTEKYLGKKRKTLLSLTGRAHGPTLSALAPHPCPAASPLGPATPIWPSSRAARHSAAARPLALACVPRRGSRPAPLFKGAARAPMRALAAASRPCSALPSCPVQRRPPELGARTGRRFDSSRRDAVE